MPPADEIPILTPDPETTIREIESGLLLWHDPSKPIPHLTTRGGGRNNIAIVTNSLNWKKSADPHWASEPYVISTDKVLGNVFLDFNIKVIGIGR
ncbi:MAG: hypothetical protein ABIF71_09140 [Planctomycetota bacterium]